ncbi:MAG TPA: glycosyltransferase family 4 protein [Saprospiraceae bacterium]|nr:glycosyltransferase family 4 protein [Saprospiraceae bacterium]
MKITVVNRHRSDIMGGSEVQCDFIASELVQRGHDVTYVAVKGKKKYYDVSYKVLPCKSEGSEILESIVKSRPDLVYWRYHKNFIYDIFKKLDELKIKIIFAVSSEYDTHRFLYNKKQSLYINFRKWLRNINQFRGIRYVDAVVVNNESHLNRLPVKRQQFIPNGMTDEYVSFKWKRPYCIWIANIKSIKRPELYIDLANQIKDVDFLMVGAIQEQKYNWVEDDENLPDNLHYLGPKSLTEVNGMIRESLFHIHTCMAEGFPNVFIQAWIFGKASVSYGFDPSGYIEKENLGMCSNENSEQFYNDVKEMIQNEELRDKKGANAQLFANKMFRIETSVGYLVELADELLKTY